ncbi:MAG TPA: hypothetical protein VF598_07030 [Hymenobacter sp.]|jgi:hypothetical protein
MVLQSAPEYLQLAFRSDLQVLVARWMRQPTQQEMREGYNTLLSMARVQASCYWLVDTRRRDRANQESTQWMIEVFFPQVAAQLHDRVYVAYLFMPNHLREVEADASVPPLTYFDNRPYQVARFTEEQAAMEWLAHCRRSQS